MKKLWILLLTLMAVVAKGQNLMPIEGTVSDMDSKTALRGVMVKSSNNNQVLTNEHGAFTISSFVNDTLTFLFVGFEPTTHIVTKGEKIKIY